MCYGEGCTLRFITYFASAALAASCSLQASGNLHVAASAELAFQPVEVASFCESQHDAYPCVCVQASRSRLSGFECKPEERACMVNGRLRIPCGNGFVTLPAMSGIG